MKTNGKKAIIATMAIAMAAGIAGSISGTVAWFQYNTRVTSEFTGTTAKCTEFLQVRTKKNVLALKESGASLPDSGYSVGERFFNTTDKKVYTCIRLNGTAPVFDAGFAAQNGGIYKVGAGDNQKFNGTALAAATDADLFGEWKTSLANEDILAATAGLSDSGLKPVAYPGDKDAALGTLYGQPVCGYEQYAAGTYHWQTAETMDYYGFDLQFRVLDVDGAESGATPNLYVQNLYLTDITVAESAVANKKNVSSAIRVHVDGGENKRALLAPGAGSAADLTTTTHGNLDLGGATGADTQRDVPNNYSWTDGQATVLDYGKDKGTQTAYDMNKKMAAAASNGIYPQNDGVGHLTGGRALGTTAADNVEANQLTIHFTIFLEGWQTLGDTPSTLWSSKDYIGAKFNIGMSFGVTTLD